MNNLIESLIRNNETEGDFNHATVSSSMIESAESKLSLKLPDEYKEFLFRYGHGGIGGFEILGVGLTGRLIFQDVTLDYRNDGLPENLVVIENADEWLMCIDCNTGKIVSWDMGGTIRDKYNSFDEYLLDHLQNAIDNL